MDALSDAVAAGFLRSEEIRSDHELDPLRPWPKFQDLEKTIARKVRANASEGARKRLAERPSFAFDFELPSLDGKKVAIANFKGRVTIVDLWGTWCPPCRRAIPHLIDLYKKYHDQGLEIVGINYEHGLNDDVKDVIQRFVQENNIPYPCLIGDAKTQNQVPNFQGFPTTLYLDRSGTVRAKIEGFDPEMALEMDEIVTSLLAEKLSEKRK